MKFTCEKYLLQSAIATASRAVPSKSTTSALEGLLIEASNNIKITGYDLKKGIYTSFSADVQEAGSIVLSARLFSEIIRSMPEGIVTITSGGNGMTSIVCGDTDFSIMGIPADDYPELPAVDRQKSVSIPEKLLKTMISQTNFAVSDNESRPVYTGALFEIDEKNLTVVAVDGFRLALRKEKLESAENSVCSFIVPGSSLSELEKICTDNDDPVGITVGMKHISFTIGDTVLISRRLEGEFLNYKKSIPEAFGVVLEAEKPSVIKSVERVSLIIDDKAKNPLRCILGENEIKFYCSTAVGKAEDTCPVEGSGTDIEIGFNNRYLLDCLKAAPAEKVNICVNSGSEPCVILPSDGGDSFKYMVLPVRLKAE